MPTLNWLTREADIRAASRAPYRLLEEARELSAGDPEAGNMLIQGDNLEGLKALLPFFAGKVKCVYIDPPYNTRSAFAHYEDNLEHARWLATMWPRLELLRDLLAEDGSIWMQLDDNEAHYARVVLDELMGRNNFIADVIWQKSYAVRSNAEFISSSTEHIFWYCKTKIKFRPNKLSRSDVQISRFSNPDNDPRGRWQSITFTISLLSGARGRQYAKTGTSPNLYEVISPDGTVINPPPGRCWARSKDTFEELDADNRIWWGPEKNRTPRLKMFLSEADDSVIPTTLWANGEEFGFNQDAVREVRALDIEFPTPKPERLIQRILHIATNPGDLVLDSFLGSGTTAAVAHKMGRRWIGIEMGDHAVTHCAPRLARVVEGEEGGVSKALGWRGGGGFRFHRLGPPAFDSDGRIRPGVGFPVLAAHVWFSETGRAWNGQPAGAAASPVLGVHEGRARALLYNGVLGDRRPRGGNVLTRATLAAIRAGLDAAGPGFAGPLTVYGESSRLAPATLAREGVTFRQIPYEIAARGREATA